MKIAVFPCSGLGDGLLSMILSNNLHLQGHEVTTFHPFLGELQAWFPGLKIEKFPPAPHLGAFERIFIFYEATPHMEGVLTHALEKRRAETTVLNPIATPNTDYRFWEEGRFDGSKPLVENLYHFCRDVLAIEEATIRNGITLLPGTELRTHYGRVVIHPTSSRRGKSWSKEKFLRVAADLVKHGWEPVFVIGPGEEAEWPEGRVFPSLSEMATFIAESAYFIGNDSGLGHLASALGIPTVTLCRNCRTAEFWRPAWSPGSVITPTRWLPNIKGLRLRDERWQWGISVGNVLRHFAELRKFCDQRPEGSV